MAIPVIEDHFQAQWCWQHTSGMPEDQFCNTWYFRNDMVAGTPTEIGQTIQAVLEAFYTGQPGVSPGPIAALYPAAVRDPVLKVYDLGVPIPRYPIYEVQMAHTGGGGLSSALPYEVATVLSYYSGRGPRKRGRVYLGPFVPSVVSTAGGVPEVSTDLRTRIVEAATDVLNTTQNVTWTQVSTTYGVATPVLGGWVDDAFDTQRRRGKAPTARATWGAPAST